MKKTFKIIFILLIITLSLNSCASVSDVIEDPEYSPSFAFRVNKLLVRMSGTKKLFMHSPENVIKRSQRFPELVKRKPPNSFYRSGDLSVDQIDFNGYPCFIITPNKNLNTEKALVYLHGGGFVVSIQTFHWNVIKQIAQDAQIPVIVPLYPLYPETDPEKIIQVVDTAFLYAYEKYPDAKVFGMGDSAGAYLLISYCHYLSNTQDAQLESDSRFPDELICISVPQAVGIEDSIIDEMKAIDKYDIMISIDVLHTLPALYNLSDNEFSWFTTPLYGDFSKFPPITIIMGSYEIFYPLIPPFVKRLKSYEKEIDFYVGYKMPHCWPIFPNNRESKFAMEIILDIINKD